MSAVQSPASAGQFFYSRRQACDALSIGPTTLHKMVNAGRLRPVKLGAKTLFPASELQRFAAEVVKDGAA